MNNDKQLLPGNNNIVTKDPIRDQVIQSSSNISTRNASTDKIGDALSPQPVQQQDEHDAMSVDISVPSTYSTLPPKKKQQFSMANLYVERIFRGFRKSYDHPTISSGEICFF